MKKKIYLFSFFMIVLMTCIPDIKAREKIKLEKLEYVKILPAEDQMVFFKTSPFIAVDFTGNIYALDNNIHTIYKLDKNGKLLLKLGQPGHGPGDLYYPFHLYIDDNNIFVTDNNAISTFDLNGKFISRFRKFHRINSMAVFQNKVLLLEPTTENLITVYDYRGKKLSSFGEKFNIDYSIYKGWSVANVNWMMHLGKIVCSKNYIYYISYLVGDIFKYDSNGKLLSKREIEDIDFVEENKKIFFKEGLKNKNNLTINRRIFNDAFFFENKIYLLLFTNNIYGEIWKLDKNHLEIEKRYSYFNPARIGKFKSGSLATARSENNAQLFYISFYDKNTGDILISEYKKGGEK